MTAGALGEERPTLFLRKATGLVRGWSVRDSLIYACLATNFVTLGIYEFTFAGPAFPKGQLITATIIGGVWVSFLVIAYSGLVVTIPRAGGDYVWQTRILTSGIGFVTAVTGWWFILWLWAPIYGNILAVQLFQPIWATLKWTWPTGGAAWFGTHNGVFIVTLITVVGYIVGFRIGTNVGLFLCGALIVLIFAYSLGWGFATVGLTASNAETAQVMAFPILFPLTFASSAFVPVSSMPGWLQAFAKHQPVTQVVDAARSLMVGGVTHNTSSIYQALAWCAGLLIVLVPLAVSKFRQVG